MKTRRLLQWLALTVSDGLVIAIACEMTCTRVAFSLPILTGLLVSTRDYMLGDHQCPAADSPDPAIHRRRLDVLHSQ